MVTNNTLMLVEFDNDTSRQTSGNYSTIILTIEDNKLIPPLLGKCYVIELRLL